MVCSNQTLWYALFVVYTTNVGTNVSKTLVARTSWFSFRSVRSAGGRSYGEQMSHVSGLLHRTCQRKHTGENRGRGEEQRGGVEEVRGAVNLCVCV